jgi:endonuclease/exonuclease/phosphatase family metal-dependent hydrolase
MSKQKVPNITVILILITFGIIKGYSQDLNQNKVRMMFYNVENLFDIYNDPATEDDEFLPGGVMRWNSSRYYKKINSLYKTIIAAGGWMPPQVISMCEIENRKVLEDLVFGTYLSKYNYRIIHENSPDRRGIDVCLLYRNDCVEILDYKYLIPDDLINGYFSSRSVLYAKMTVMSDTIHLFVNHWPSRRGGVLAGEELRMRIAAMVKEKSDSIVLMTTGRAKIIIMGDLNCTPDDLEVNALIAQEKEDVYLVNLSDSTAQSGKGTYRYMGTWEMIDQVIVSKGLFKCKYGLYSDNSMLSVFSPDFLLKKDPKYPGFSPFSTYLGYRYQGGFSDHLPVLIDLRLR